MRYLLAGHGEAPNGLRDTVGKITGDEHNLDVLCIGAEGEEFKEEFDRYYSRYSGEGITVFTDLMIGSVNQFFMYRLLKWNFYLYTGVTASLVVEVIRNCVMDEESAEKIVAENREKMWVQK